ncbi:MAG TPA: nucleoside deaminase [Candidatus Onthovicinus excrementipullorum]|nr:nucleoside deaminase [Candidatus Onthovicinus excrementipullorum]
MTEQELMRRALELARQAQAEGEIPVGAVIARNGKIIAEGRNDRERAHSALGHAEIRAIDAACRRLGRWRLNDCELYVTLEPCPMCAGAIINARIGRLIYGAFDNKMGACGGRVHLFKCGFNHTPQIECGFMEEECAAVMREFFKKIRDTGADVPVVEKKEID